ncbi:hypothetical protein SHIRM173S_08486 [Streptomyces hirsutus]
MTQPQPPLPAPARTGPAAPTAAPPVRFASWATRRTRRVTLFADGVRAAGLPAPRVVPWAEVLRAGGADFAPGEIVRLDSPGENPEVDRLLRDTPDRTRVEGSAHWYARFTRAVRELRGGVRLDDAGDLAVLFDKRRCHAILAAADVPVPRSPTSGEDAAPVRGWDDVRAVMREHRMPRLFVKLAHGSSASGVLAVEVVGRRTCPGHHLRLNWLRTELRSTPSSCAVTNASGTSPRSSTRWHPTACTSNAGCPRPRWGAAPPTCGSWWWTAARPTPWCAPAPRR